MLWRPSKPNIAHLLALVYPVSVILGKKHLSNPHYSLQYNAQKAAARVKVKSHPVPGYAWTVAPYNYAHK